VRISLRYKSALLIALAEFALLALLLVSNQYNTRRDLEEQLHIHAASTADLVAASATEPLLALDLAQLRSLLKGVVNRHRITYTAITDHCDRLLADAGKQMEPGHGVRVERPIAVAGSLFGTVVLEVSRAETDAALAATTRANVVIAMIEIFLVALISLSLGWFITRSLTELARGAEAIGRGDYRTRVPVASQDEVGMLAARFNDMAARLQDDIEEITRGHKRFRDMADNISDWLWETDAEGRYTYASNRVETLLDYTPDQVVGTRIFDLMSAEDAKRLEALFESVRQERRPFHGFEYRARRRDGDGTEVTLEANGSPILTGDGRLVGYRGVTRDVTRRKEDEARLVYLAEHDALTGLLARRKFLEILDDEIRLARYSGVPVTVLFIDLDDFKLINDTHGHIVGDSLLRSIADILSRQAGHESALARLGGDEFGVILRGTDAVRGLALARQLLAAVESAEFAADESAVHVRASIGVCVYPEGGQDSETLLACSDIAMSHAKSLGHSRCHVYQSTDRDLDTMRQTVNWQAVIHDAIETGRLSLDFQPMVCVSGKTSAAHFEALIRLRDKKGELFLAREFIHTAEHTGQIIELDRWVLGAILEVLAEPKNRNCVIAMNLSGRSLGAPGFDDYFRERLFESGIQPGRVVFEVTETAAVAEMAKAKSFIATMKKLGYRFSLDDFGVGFSSFSYLKHLPVDQIKIDGSFIRHLDTNREDQIFVRAIVQVARELGMETVAEFVENKTTLELLLDMGVDFVQGYYVGKPGPTLTFPAIEPRPSKLARNRIGRG
jgi:diguanylate cyclase (GGDEF)-like protein/PAS domain S-box-containing protein